jgi:cyanate permease
MPPGRHHPQKLWRRPLRHSLVIFIIVAGFIASAIAGWTPITIDMAGTLAVRATIIVALILVVLVVVGLTSHEPTSIADRKAYEIVERS